MSLETSLQEIGDFAKTFFWASFYISCGIVMLAGANYLRKKSERKDYEKDKNLSFRELGLGLLSRKHNIKNFEYKCSPKLDQPDLL